MKFENSIKRVEGTADNPRQVERVPAGAKFNVEIVVNVWDNDVDGRKSIEMLERGIKALVNDYLGGNGSRGYGQVKLQKISSQEVTL